MNGFNGTWVSSQMNESIAYKEFIPIAVAAYFCIQSCRLHANGSPCPGDEWALCLFVMFLADSIHDTSIKVYLSAVRALHIEQGLPDPLVGCFRLQCVVRGIKRSQGSTNRQRFASDRRHHEGPSFQSLETSRPDHCTFLGCLHLSFFFGFLCSAVFMVQGSKLTFLLRSQLATKGENWVARS